MPILNKVKAIVLFKRLATFAVYYLSNTLKDLGIMETAMLQIQKLSFSYGKKRMLFRDFSLDIEAGKVIGLLGKNGTGKSTLLYLMCGLLRPKKGSILFKGVDVWRHCPDLLSDMYLLPEEFMLPSLRLKEFVCLNAPFYPRFSDEILRSCLRDFNLDSDIHLGELSMGQKKKVRMSFALATNTRLLLMDEPTNGLDIPSKSQFRKVMATGMNDEKTVVISTHQVRDVDRILDHIIVIDEAELLLNQSVSKVMEKLFFAEQEVNAPANEALYMQPSVYGNSVILPNATGEDSVLNLEILFNALFEAREKIQRLFNE